MLEATKVLKYSVATDTFSLIIESSKCGIIKTNFYEFNNMPLPGWNFLVTAEVILDAAP